MMSTVQAATQFLTSVLQQRGPQALPYEEDEKWTIRHHILLVCQEFPSLQVKTAEYTHNDGRSSNLLQVDGTIPMYYQDVRYNIPITVWLLEKYPRQPPLIFVTPTRDMIIKSRHPNVDPSGTVRSLYTQRWVYPRSNLVELVQSLSLLFGTDPPLYSRPVARSVSARPPSPPNTYPPPPVMHSSYTGGMSPRTNSPSLVYPPVQSPRYQYPPYQQSPPSPPPIRNVDPQEQFKRNAINTLTERLKNDTQVLIQKQNSEMDRHLNTQALLGQRSEQLKNGLWEFIQEKEGLENQLQVTLTNTDVLEMWLKANDKGITYVDIDDVFDPADIFSNKLLEFQATDLAIEDILYSLDKGAQDLVIPIETYLKHVRVLSREQFMFRAASHKIRERQVTAQIQSMAARVS